jgi:hypothetical protein
LLLYVVAIGISFEGLLHQSLVLGLCQIGSEDGSVLIGEWPEPDINGPKILAHAAGRDQERDSLERYSLWSTLSGLSFMTDLIIQAIQALQAETSSYPHAVQIWMRVLGLSLLSSVFFIFWRSSARWILAILIVNLAGLIIAKVFWPDASRSLIGTVVHLIFWPPLLWAAWSSYKQQRSSTHRFTLPDKIYTAWFYWVSTLVVISLLFDLRAAAFN